MQHIGGPHTMRTGRYQPYVSGKSIRKDDLRFGLGCKVCRIYTVNAIARRGGTS
ncbi:MAG: hypothetical protein VB016_00475 [Methanomassiliicoccaceae archaeon]|nr:hypothetical protein [Methanomassiliicoccaceae archaeon]